MCQWLLLIYLCKLAHRVDIEIAEFIDRSIQLLAYCQVNSAITRIHHYTTVRASVMPTPYGAPGLSLTLLHLEESTKFVHSVGYMQHLRLSADVLCRIYRVVFRGCLTPSMAIVSKKPSRLCGNVIGSFTSFKPFPPKSTLLPVRISD